MTKKELCQEIKTFCNTPNILSNTPNKVIEAVLNGYHNVMRVSLKKGLNFQVGNIVVLKPVTRPARQCRNPQNGEMVNVPEKKSIKVFVATAMKKELNG